MPEKATETTQTPDKTARYLLAKAEDAGQRRIKTYNFRRPDKFTAQQIQTVRMMHETFARLTSTSLSAYLRLFSHIRVAAVDQLTYEEFIRSIPNPATLMVIAMAPLNGYVLLETDPSLAFPMIDRLFGGQGKAVPFNRDLTDIEAKLMETLSDGLLGNLRESWSTIIDLQPRLISIETNPAFAQIVPPPEMVMLVSFEAKIGEAKGMINFCIPYLTIEPLIAKLSASYWFSHTKKSIHEGVVETVSGLKLETELYYKGESLSLRTIHKLKKGSCIKLPKYSEKEVFLRSGEKTVLKLRSEITKGGKDPVFRLETSSRLSNDGITEILPKKKDGELKNLLSAVSQKVTAEFKQGLSSLHEDIEQIRKKQDELAEQIYFNESVNDREEDDRRGNYSLTPFGFITMTQTDFLFMIIQQEHPQTIALVLSYIPAEMAGQILLRLPVELQIDVTERIALIDRTTPESLKACEQEIKKKLELFHMQEFKPVGGIKGVVDILNTSPRSVEKNIIEGLDKSNAELSEEIKKNMFVFEDIVLLDKKAVKILIAAVSKEELALALKKTDPRVNDFISQLLTKEEQEEIRHFQEIKSPAKITDIEEAQVRIVDRIRQLEENGKIIVARPGETV
ncbi:MAG: flagellar motor switch protein FliM [Spirochaetales bacterium]|nr:flagellar motor switch protein FliM [Spirochaetales bacterium]